MPSEAPWTTTQLSFTDKPEEKFFVQYRNVLDAVKALLGDTELAEHLVYRPSRVFTDNSRKSHVYSEMWTGKWWSSVQASHLPLLSTEIPYMIRSSA